MIQQPSQTSRVLLWTMVGVIGLLTINWIMAVARFQVNLLFWDQWEFMQPLFEDEGWWSLFIWQHGPHRQGLAHVLTSWVLQLSGWDTRWESLWIVLIMVATTVVLLLWKQRLTGSLGWGDLWIPLAALGMRQWENVMLVPNASHSHFPLLLLAVGAWVAAASSSILKWWLLGVVGFFALFTGFGIFVWGALLWGTIMRLVAAVRGRVAWSAMWGQGLVLGLLLLALAVFLQDYRLNPASTGAAFPHWPLWDYPRFVMVMLASRMELTGQSLWVYLGGGFMLLAGLAAWWDSSRRVVNTESSSAGDVAASLFLTAGLSFAFFAAAGRVHLGMAAGEVPRYTPLLIAVWLGLLAWAFARQNRGWMAGALGLGWLMALLPWTDLPDRELRDWPGTLGMGSATRAAVHQSQGHKIHWLKVWEDSGYDWEAATEQVPPGLHARADGVALGQKIQWLQERELSFWADREAGADSLPWWSPVGVQRLSGWGGEGRQWIGESGDWVVDGVAPGFINLKAFWVRPELGDSPELEVRWAGRSATLRHEDIMAGVSLPLIDRTAKFTLVSLDGTVPMQAPDNMTPTSFVIEDPYTSVQPQYPVRWWAPDGTGLWDESEESSVDGLWNWESEETGPFVWSRESVVLDLRSWEQRFWNIQIDSRYAPVDEGPVQLRWNGRILEMPFEPGGMQFSVRLPGRDIHRVELVNPVGTASPQDRGESDDARELALRLNVVELSESARFPVVEFPDDP